MQVTFNAFAYINSWQEMAQIESGEQLPSIWSFEDKTEAIIGTAVVTITLFPKAEIHTKELATLNKKLQEVRAENHVRESAILDRISKLTAIGY